MSDNHFKYDFTSASPPGEQINPFRLELKNITRSLMASITPKMADLLDVVMAVYAADRQSRRNYKGVSTGQREFFLRLALREPDFWKRPDLLSHLQSYLNWVSEDVWSFEFVPRDSPLTWAESELFLLDNLPERPTTVSLFSGGLDSLGGLFTHRRNGRSGSHVLVSAYSHGRLMKQQKIQARQIEAGLCGCGSEQSCPVVRHLTVPYGLCRKREIREEPTQRTRATVFLTFGVITALQAQTNILWVYENGTGAFNLPLNGTQLGIDNYRGVHPRSLLMAEKLFQLALEENVRIINPFVFSTKAQILGSLQPAGVAGLVRETVSCDGYPVRVAGRPQCGNCTSCILRRQALHSSGLSAHDKGIEYQHDVLTDGQALDSEHRFGLEVMRGQAHDLKLCLSAADPWKALTSKYPELARTALEMESGGRLKPGEAASRIAGLYQNYVSEWDALTPAFGYATEGESR